MNKNELLGTLLFIGFCLVMLSVLFWDDWFPYDTAIENEDDFIIEVDGVEYGPDD